MYSRTSTLVFLAAALSVVSRGQQAEKQNMNATGTPTGGLSTLLANASIDDNAVQVTAPKGLLASGIKSSTSLDRGSSILDKCDPFCPPENHPLSDALQLKVLERNMDRLRMYFYRRGQTVSGTAGRNGEDAKGTVGGFAQLASYSLVDTTGGSGDSLIVDNDKVSSEVLPPANPRVSDNDEYEPLCTSVRTITVPTSAKDVHGDKHFILNPSSGEYQQVVETEQCESFGSPCSAIDSYVPPGRRTLCRTQFFRRGLTAINTSSYEPYDIVVTVPSGCNCFIQAAY